MPPIKKIVYWSLTTCWSWRWNCSKYVLHCSWNTVHVAYDDHRSWINPTRFRDSRWTLFCTILRVLLSSQRFQLLYPRFSGLSSNYGRSNHSRRTTPCLHPILEDNTAYSWQKYFMLYNFIHILLPLSEDVLLGLSGIFGYPYTRVSKKRFKWRRRRRISTSPSWKRWKHHRYHQFQVSLSHCTNLQYRNILSLFRHRWKARFTPSLSTAKQSNWPSICPSPWILYVVCILYKMDIKIL